MPFVQQHSFLIPAICLGMIIALFVFDLFTWRRPLVVTVLGGLIFVGANPVMDVIDHTAFAHRVTVWAQHHP